MFKLELIPLDAKPAEKNFMLNSRSNLPNGQIKFVVRLQTSPGEQKRRKQTQMHFGCRFQKWGIKHILNHQSGRKLDVGF